MRQPEHELVALLSGVLDGTTAAGDQSRISELMRQHPRLQQDYLEAMHLHALLIWRSGKVASPDATTEPQLLAIQAGNEPPDRAELSETTPRRQSFRWRVARAAAILALSFCLGGVLFLALEPRNPEAPTSSEEVVDRLVVWDLEIAQAPTPDDRRVIFESRAPSMQGLIIKARLCSEDQELANSLVDTGVWLTEHDDPMAQAERFGEIADKILARLDSSTEPDDASRATRYADSYYRLTEIGVAANLERALAVSDPKHKPKLDHLLASDVHRGKKLEELLQRNPDASWKVIHRALKGRHHKSPPAAKSGI